VPGAPKYLGSASTQRSHAQKGYERRDGQLQKSRLCRATRNVADPKPWPEAAALVEAMHQGVLATTLKEDVITVFGPSCGQRSVNNGVSMTSAPKIGMSNDIFEKSMLTTGAQEIWRGDEHAGRNNFGVRIGYEDRNAFVRKHVRPNLFGSLLRLRAGAYFRDSIELKQRSKVTGFSKPGIWHLNTRGANRS
jgi:hypothetical protein